MAGNVRGRYAVHRLHPLLCRGWVELTETLTLGGAVDYMMRDEALFMADSVLPEYRIIDTDTGEVVKRS